MADTAVLTALIAGGTGVLSGLIGYGGARSQIALERLKFERDEREAREARSERAAEALRNLYLEYLNLHANLTGLLNDPALKASDLGTWFRAIN